MENINWFWNNNRNNLPTITTTVADGTGSVVSSAQFYSNTLLTDVGICVGMRNVNLNFVPRNFGRAIGRPAAAALNYKQSNNNSFTNYNGYVMSVPSCFRPMSRSSVYSCPPKQLVNPIVSRGGCADANKCCPPPPSPIGHDKNKTIFAEPNPLTVTPKKKWMQRHYMMGEERILPKI